MQPYTSLNLIQQDLKLGRTSCSELIKFYLSKIESKLHLNALIEVYADEATNAASAIDEKIAKGTAGKLAGLVITIKDVLSYKDHVISGGSKILSNFEAQYHATAVERLIKEDAIIIGRANCDEFGMGSSNENSSFGPVLNGMDEERVPGGSSGGSAVAVQQNMCLVSIGTDTGGSVRQPASFCGVIGFKPTYSRISRYGLYAYASSFDCIGILAKDISDVAKVLEVMAGKDDYDSTVSSFPVPSYPNLLGKEIPKKKIAFVKESIASDGLSPDIKNATHNLLNKLEVEGHNVTGLKFPMLEYLLPTYYILTMAESSSNLSRYDGMKYGYRAETKNGLKATYKTSRTEGFGEEVKRRIMLGTFVLSADYYDAYYEQAQKVRRLIREETKKILSDYDFIIMPTTPTTAFKLGEKTDDPTTMYIEDLLTVQASVCGIPAISLPLGKDNENLPIGVQIMANDFEEAELLAFSNYLMKLDNA